VRGGGPNGEGAERMAVVDTMGDTTISGLWRRTSDVVVGTGTDVGLVHTDTREPVSVK
jgi:hypothetical protein